MSDSTRCRKARWLLLGGATIISSACLVTASVAVAQVSALGTGGSISTVGLASESTLTTSTLRMLGALCFCLGILGIGVRIARRFAGAPTSSRRRRIEVRDKTALSSKATLFLVAVDNREYLIASCSNSISVTPAHSITTPLFAESLDEVCQATGELHA